jgi:hypothetical protein
MRVVYIIVLLFVLFLGVVYGVLSATGNDRVDMTGKVVGICQDGSGGVNSTFKYILVEGTAFGSSQNQNISVKITDNTTIVFKQGNELKNASTSDLKSGEIVEIKFTGKFLQTYPPQINALQIIILK